MANQVLKADAQAADAFLTKSFGGHAPPWWIQFDLLILHSAFTNIFGVASSSADFLDIDGGTDGILLTGFDTGGGSHSFEPSGNRNYFTEAGSTVVNGGFVDGVWQTIKVHYDGTTAKWYANGSLIFTNTVALTLSDIEFGAQFAAHLTGEVYYLDNLKVGTSDGGSDILCEDFEAGNFSQWSSTTGAVSIVADPGSSPAPGPGCAPVAPGITLAPISGQTTAPVSVSGDGFAPSAPLSATFDGSPISLTGTTVTDGSGGFTGSLFVVPNLPAGVYPVVFSDGTSSAAASYTILATPLLTGSALACSTYPEDDAPSNHTDPITINADVPANNWLMLVQLGGYAFANGPLLYCPTTPSVDAVPFDSFRDPAFAFNNPPNLTPEWNEAVLQQAHTDPITACGDPYVDDTYPTLAYSAPGLLSTSVSAGHVMNIHWNTGALKKIEAYAAFIARVNAPFDVSADEPIWLEGSSSDTGGSTDRVASGATAPPCITSAASLAAAGHGAVAIAAIAWNDTGQVPTLTPGWSILATCADATTGWAGLLAGRMFHAGDTSAYILTATFTSSVKSASVIDTWQLAVTPGIHIKHRVAFG